MLYDPKWETKTNPLTVESFISWLEKQPADGEYSFLNCKECAIGQYAKSVGLDYYDIPLKTRFMWNWATSVGNFGGATERARTLVGLELLNEHYFL